MKTYFLGYGRNMFGYKCWIPETKEVIRAKNVVFVESDLFKHKASSSRESNEMIDVDILPEQNEVVQNRDRIDQTVTDEVDGEESESEDRMEDSVDDRIEEDVTMPDENDDHQFFRDTSHYVKKDDAIL